MSFKIGDKVTSFLHGAGEVISVVEEDVTYPIKCSFFKEPNIYKYFTKDGFFHRSHARPILYPMGTTFEIKEPPFTSPKLGSVWLYRGVRSSLNKYLLAQVNENYICLIRLENGNRLIAPVRVENPNKITKEEWVIICAGDLFILDTEKL